MLKNRLVAATLLLCAAPAAHAARTATWEMNSYRDFVRGTFSAVSLSRDGQLTLAPQVQTVFSSGQPIVWALVQAPDGTLYAGTGHRGQVYQISADGKTSKLLWTAEEPQVFALAIDSRGALYAATSPSGKVYRIENGAATEYFNPGATYIWSLAVDRNGILYAGTGNEGKIFRIEGAGKGEVYYETGQSHVTSLALDAQNRLLAGSEPNGILYRVENKGRAFVLYDSNLPEIRSIIPAPDGSVYAAAMGGSVAQRMQGAPAQQQPAGTAPAVSTTVTTVTVTDEAAAAAAQGGIQAQPQPGSRQVAPPATTPPATPLAGVEVAGVERSALYRIMPDNTVETLWTSQEENVYDLIPLPGRVLFSTDVQGRIYRLSPERQTTLVVQTNEGETTRLLQTSSGILAATGNTGKVLRLGEALGGSGSYEAPVHDAGNTARWGRLSWRAESCPGCRLSFQTRSGNSARPDATWSDWSPALTASDGEKIASPNARFLQWRVEIAGAKGATPRLDAVTAAYLPQNTPPAIHSISVTNQITARPAAPGATTSAGSGVYSVTVTDTGDAAQSLSGGTPTQRLARLSAEEVQISWNAEDQDGDRLTYAIYFRGDGEADWKLLKDRLMEPQYTMESTALADGRYFFRVVASDHADNPPPMARQAELVSSPVIVDHTPPTVTIAAPRREGARMTVQVQARDEASALTRAEYSLNAGPWTLLPADDGVVDSPQENFTLTLENLPAGEHLLTVRVFDTVENAGVAKAILRP